MLGESGDLVAMDRTATDSLRLLSLAKHGCLVSELAVSFWPGACLLSHSLRGGSGLRSHPHLREATHQDGGSAADSGTQNIKVCHFLEDAQDADCIFTSMRRALNVRDPRLLTRGSFPAVSDFTALFYYFGSRPRGGSTTRRQTPTPPPQSQSRRRPVHMEPRWHSKRSA